MSIFTVSIVSCKKDKGDQKPKDMIYTEPKNIQLDEGDETKVRLFVNSNHAVAWQLTNSPPFMHIEPQSGYVDKKGIELTISVANSGLLEGDHDLDLSFIVSGVGVFETDARVYIPAKYHYSFLQDSVVFQQNETSKYVRIVNLSNTDRVPTLDSDKQWASSYLDFYQFRPNTLEEAKIIVEKRMVHAGWNEAFITITPNSTEAHPLKIRYFVNPFTLFEASVNNIMLDREYETSFYLINAGTEFLEWTLQNMNEVLNVIPVSGSLSSGDSALIQVKAIDPITYYGIYEGDIIVSNTGGSEPIVIQSQLKHYETNVQSYQDSFVDAVYHNEPNEIVVITKTENEIKIINPETNSIRKVSLPAVPSGLCLFNDGQQIAVGVAGKVLIYNYQTLELSKTVNLFFDYLLPYRILERNDGNLILNCANDGDLLQINKQNWALTVIPSDHFIDFWDSYILLNPAFEALYMMDFSRLLQYNLTDSTASYVKSVYFDVLTNKAFVSTDGTTLISDRGNKYSLSSLENQNLILTGQIPAGQIFHLTYFNQNSQIAWVEVEQKGHVTITDLQDQSTHSIVNLPYLSFYYNYQPVLIPPTGKNVFVNADGTKIISVFSYQHSIQGHPKWGIYVSPLTRFKT